MCRLKNPRDALENMVSFLILLEDIEQIILQKDGENNKEKQEYKKMIPSLFF